MACGCKSKAIGQPTAIKQVVRNKNSVTRTANSNTTQNNRNVTPITRRIVRRPL